jgi:carbamoylphosphate synthase large subunit
MHVIFLEPAFPANQRQFVRALKIAGAHVSGIGDRPVEYLDPELRSWLDGYEQVPSSADPQAVTEAVRRIQQRGPWVHRLECTVEALMYCAAEAREATGIPGLTVAQTTLCRDKFEMKQFLRTRGVPCAAAAPVHTGDDARAFLAEHGYPAILKPRDGAGAAATYRLDGLEDLARALAETGLDERPAPFTIEEFMTGHEGFYDTLTVGGEVVFESVAHYYPNVLEAMRTRWISPQIVMTNRIDAPGYSELKAFGRRVIAELGLETTPTHMEWFFGDKGLAFSEIGARPPGCCMWDLYCLANDIDIYLEWAKAVVHGRATPCPSREFSAGMISLRPSQDGVVKGYSGVEAMEAKYGRWIVRSHFPRIGSRTNDVGAGYLGHAWVWVRHPDYDVCRQILNDIGETVKMWAE